MMPIMPIQPGAQTDGDRMLNPSESYRVKEERIYRAVGFLLKASGRAYEISDNFYLAGIRQRELQKSKEIFPQSSTIDSLLRDVPIQFSPKGSYDVLANPTHPLYSGKDSIRLGNYNSGIDISRYSSTPVNGTSIDYSPKHSRHTLP